VIAVVGDSAFGFSCAELETMCRYDLPVVFIILNNNGIYQGLPNHEGLTREQIPVTSLLPTARYELIAEAFGGRGWQVDNAQDLRQVLPEAMQCGKTCVVNVKISPMGQRKPQQFAWLSRDAGATSKL